jgi:hypothetical protein
MIWEKKIISYVKDEGSNLNTMISALKSIVSCDILNLAKSFQNSYFGHASLRLVSMLQLIRKFVKIWNMYM